MTDPLTLINFCAGESETSTGSGSSAPTSARRWRSRTARTSDLTRRKGAGRQGDSRAAEREVRDRPRPRGAAARCGRWRCSTNRSSCPAPTPPTTHPDAAVPVAAEPPRRRRRAPGRVHLGADRVREHLARVGGRGRTSRHQLRLPPHPQLARQDRRRPRDPSGPRRFGSRSTWPVMWHVFYASSLRVAASPSRKRSGGPSQCGSISRTSRPLAASSQSSRNTATKPRFERSSCSRASEQLRRDRCTNGAGTRALRDRCVEPSFVQSAGGWLGEGS